MDSPSSYVVFVGGANLDVIGRPLAPMVARDSNPGRIAFSFGGVARNIAENLARLDVPVELIAGVGMGLEGSMILNHCKDVGIGTNSVVHASTGRSSVYLALCDDEGDMAWAVSDMSAVAAVNPKELEARQSLLNGAAIIVADANLSIESLNTLNLLAPEVPLYIDPVSTTKARKLNDFQGSIHTLKINRIEAEALSGHVGETPNDIQAIASLLLAQGTKRVIITLGAGSVYWKTAEDEAFYELEILDAVDTTGAGDAFFAGVVFADLHGFDRTKTLEYSSAVAGLTVQSESTVNPQLCRKLVESRLSKKESS